MSRRFQDEQIFGKSYFHWLDDPFPRQMELCLMCWTGNRTHSHWWWTSSLPDSFVLQHEGSSVKLCLMNRNINDLFPSSICHFVVYILMNVKYMQRYQHINIFASISGPEVSDVIMFYAYFINTESLTWIENQAGGKKMFLFYCLA